MQESFSKLDGGPSTDIGEKLMSATGNWLAIETLAVGTLYEGQFKLSTQMIKPNCLAPPTKHLTSLKIYPI